MDTTGCVILTGLGIPPGHLSRVFDRFLIHGLSEICMRISDSDETRGRASEFPFPRGMSTRHRFMCEGTFLILNAA